MENVKRVYQYHNNEQDMTISDLSKFIAESDSYKETDNKWYCSEENANILSSLIRFVGGKTYTVDKDGKTTQLIMGYPVEITEEKYIRFGNDNYQVKLYILPVPSEIGILENEVKILEREVRDLKDFKEKHERSLLEKILDKLSTDKD